ncbi:MAG: PKD domain-containing protein [Bacteroidetes bacterium]|nr:PKD domain-containing protein [Bacteroidota bacterium]
MVLYLSADAPARVTVSISNTGWSQTVNIPANTVDASILIPKTGTDDARIFNEGLQNKAIHIVSDTPIVVYAHMYNGMISAATMLIPVESYGFKYYSLNYSQAQSGSSPPHPPINTTQNGPDWYSWFYVVAAEDNTRIEIIPADTTRNGWLPTQAYTVNLNKGQIYSVMGKLGAGSRDWEASKDMTGSKILSVPGADGNCHPVALFSGSSGIRLCKNDGGENMQQQVFPTQAWGTRYLTYHTLNNTNTDINDPFKNFYRIAVTDPTTVVKRNGTPLTGLIKNFYYEIIDSTGGDFIEADKPILMAQYTPGGNRCYLTSQFAYGDPEMFYLSPVEQGRKDVLFYATRKQNIDYNYLNVIVPTAGLASLRLDGNLFDPLNIRTHPANPAYSVAIARILGAAAQHHITCDSIFTGTMYGLGYFESYGYNIGTYVNNLNGYIQIKNTLNTTGNTDSFTCPKTPVRLYAKIGFPATNIHWKLSQVPGISPNTDSIIANPVPIGTESINGRTYYVYTLQQDFTFAGAGTYTIPVSYSATVIENCSQTEHLFLKVIVKPGPVSDFSFANLCFRDTVRFTGTPTPGIFNLVNYRWDFLHDLSFQNGITAKKLYPSTGNFDVRFRIYADNGCVGDTTKTINITSGTVPNLSFTVSGKQCKDSVLTFTSSIPPNISNPSTWYWDFGDGNTTTSATSHTITHSYSPATTNITVKHLVKFTTGCSPDTARLVIPIIHANPSVVFATVGDTLCVGKPLLFTSASTGISTWNWNFGNGSGNQIPPFNYTYTSAGTFTIRVTGTDANGCGSAPATGSITINAAPPINAGPDKFFSLGASTTIDATIASPANYNYVWTPALYLSATNILNPVANPDVSTTYTIEATDKTNFCKARDVVVITPISKLYIPTGFTPNGDGKNDKWEIPGLALYPDAHVTIYNRGGQKIYDRVNYFNKPWDGTFMGVLQPSAVYVYMIELNDDKKQLLKGTVLIIR